MATRNDPKTNMLSLTDCLYFANGSCTFKNKCHYRHCQTAIKQFEKCPNWPGSCRDVNCPFRHTKTPSTVPKSIPNQKGLVSFFWDIENVAIPKGQKPFDIVQRIRQKLVIERDLQEVDFSSYCNVNTISQENQQSLQHANVRLLHVPDRKSNASDRQIMLDLDRFERVHRPPATVVLISSDIDFVGKLSDLRHHAGFHVIVIHNKPVKSELIATVNEHHLWELFTQSPPQSLMDNILPQINEPKSKHSTPDRNLRRGNINHHSPDPISSTLNTLIVPSLDRTSISSNDSNTSPTVSPPPVVPRSRMRPAASTDQINKSKTQTFGSCEQISSTVDTTTKKVPPEMLRCPHCTNEFNTIAALRQHQKDKNHLHECPVCNAGFPTEVGLKQHQTTKGHSVTTDTENHCDDNLIQL